MTTLNKFVSPQGSGCKGATLVRLCAFLLFISIVFITFLIVLQTGKEAAFEVTAKHDLVQFVRAEEIYYGENNVYKGDVGDVISNIPNKPSSFLLEGFAPSKGVSITILSVDPFVAESKHDYGGAVFEYDFEKKMLTRGGEG